MVEEYLGEGAAGQVYKARVLSGIPTPEPYVAVKVFKSSILEKRGQLRRIERELEASQAVEGHYVTRVYELGYYGGRPFLVMEYCDGGNLTEFYKHTLLFDIENVLDWARQLFIAVRSLHSKGIVHRDIKPENLLLKREPSPGPIQLSIRLSDLGVASIVGDKTLTKSYEFLGTIRYAAPEYLLDGNYSQYSDVYSVGLVLLFMLSGYQPYPSVRNWTKLIRLKENLDPLLQIPNRNRMKFKRAFHYFEPYDYVRFEILKALVPRFLSFFPNDRLSADEALSILLNHELDVRVLPYSYLLGVADALELPESMYPISDIRGLMGPKTTGRHRHVSSARFDNIWRTVSFHHALAALLSSDM